MYLYNNQPNFTVVLPVGCNAKCSFCFWHKRKLGDNYFENLENSISKLPPYFSQVSISGGEPTMLSEENFVKLLKILRSNFDKIVLNTNGFKLKELLRNNYIRNNIDYINLSRHSIVDAENEKIFKTNNIPTTSDIIEINKLKKVRLNCVFENDVNYETWFNYVYMTGSEGVAFRRLADKGVNKKSKLEKRLDKDNRLTTQSKDKCKVCYGANYTHKDYKNINIVVRYSVDEPKDYMKKDVIFELISDGVGEIHYKWNNNNSTKIDYADIKFKNNKLERFLTNLYYKLYNEEV